MRLLAMLLIMGTSACSELRSHNGSSYAPSNSKTTSFAMIPHRGAAYRSLSLESHFAASTAQH